MPGTDPQAANPPVMMMPFFMGAPWVPKYKGTGSEIRLTEWKGQVQMMMRMQTLSEAQQVDFVIGALEGEAKREILLLGDRDRQAPEQIFKQLDQLYGDRVPIAVLRSHFFNCTQGSNESLQAFTLRLRELFCRLQRRDPRGLDSGDTLQRDQFILGLRRESLRQELRRQVRRNERLSFEETRREAVLYDEEQHSEEGSSLACQTVSKSVLNSVGSNEEWGKAFREQMLQEVKGQFQVMTQDLVKELRAEYSGRRGNCAVVAAPYDVPPEWRRRGFQANHFIEPQRHQWDPRGRPICRQCGNSGHMERQCRNRRQESVLN